MPIFIAFGMALYDLPRFDNEFYDMSVGLCHLDIHCKFAVSKEKDHKRTSTLLE